MLCENCFKLAKVILELDKELNHDEQIDLESMEKPKWCNLIKITQGNNIPEEECCGVCGVLSKDTVDILDKIFTLEDKV